MPVPPVVASIVYWRNYTDDDNTYVEDKTSSSILSIEAVGFEAPTGYEFQEWNAARDGSGYSMSAGDAPAASEVYAIWKEVAQDPYYLTKESELTSVADAIRVKGGTSDPLAFPAGFVSAINAIPTGGATTLLLGAVRPDAELIESFVYDKYINSDEGVSIPTYSTSYKVLKSSATLQRITTDTNLYDYFLTERFLSIPEYSTSDIGKGRTEYSFGTYVKEISAEGNYFALIDPTKYANISIGGYGLTNNNVIYWVTNTALSSATALDGVYQNSGTISAGSNYLTVTSPDLRIHGNTSYLSETFYNALTDIRYQYIIDVFRAPKGNLAYDGWSIHQLRANIKSCVESASHKLE